RRAVQQKNRGRLSGKRGIFHVKRQYVWCIAVGAGRWHTRTPLYGRLASMQSRIHHRGTARLGVDAQNAQAYAPICISPLLPKENLKPAQACPHPCTPVSRTGAMIEGLR